MNSKNLDNIYVVVKESLETKRDHLSIGDRIEIKNYSEVSFYVEVKKDVFIPSKCLMKVKDYELNKLLDNL